MRALASSSTLTTGLLDEFRSPSWTASAGLGSPPPVAASSRAASAQRAHHPPSGKMQRSASTSSKVTGTPNAG